MGRPEDFVMNEVSKQYLVEAAEQERLAPAREAAAVEHRRTAWNVLQTEIDKTIAVLEQCDWPTGEYYTMSNQPQYLRYNPSATMGRWVSMNDMLVEIDDENRLAWQLFSVSTKSHPDDNYEQTGSIVLLSSGEIAEVDYGNDKTSRGPVFIRRNGDDIYLRSHGHDLLNLLFRADLPFPFSRCGGLLGRLQALQDAARRWQQHGRRSSSIPIV